MKLRACPFCGSTALVLSHSGRYTIACYECSCDGPAETDRNASVIAWNNRAYDDYLTGLGHVLSALDLDEQTRENIDIAIAELKGER